ncbi:hypothetical protein [Desulfosporosinus fructosivorans]
MLKNKKGNFGLALLLGLIFALVPVSVAQAAAITFTGYTAETAYVTPISIGDLTTVGGKASITVDNLPVGAIVKVYDQSSGGKLLGSSTVKTGTSATVSLSGLNSNVYVSVTLESVRSEISVGPSTLIDANVVAKNNAGISDTVTVTGVAVGDIVKVYDSATEGQVLGTATVAKAKDVAVVSIKQLGTTAGSLYVSLKTLGKTESIRSKIDYDKELVTDELPAGSSIAVNNAGVSDTVTVTGVSVGDVVKVYDASTEGQVLGTATVAKDKDVAVVSIKQLGPEAGSIYVSLKKVGENEATTRLKTDYIAEPQTYELADHNIVIKNNAGVADTVTVTDLTSGDIIKVYNTPAKTILLGKATVAKGKTEAIASIKQLGIASGNVSVTVTSPGERESETFEKGYLKEDQTEPLEVDQIDVINNSGTADKVTVTGLEVGDIVIVYDASGTKLLGKATVAKDKTEAVVSISQLGTAIGTVKVSVTSIGKRESLLVEESYVAEVQSSSPNLSDISIANNLTANDKVTVAGLAGGDIVKVYKTSTGGILWGKATVASGVTQAEVAIRQLGSGAGEVWVTVTSPGTLESSRIKQTYLAE